jgi:hypothetical protein
MWGYKFDPRPDKWRWGDGVTDGLSVCDASCTSASCAIALHPDPSRFECAVEICLCELTRVLDLDVVAVYSPIAPNDPADPAHNPFHFELMPERRSLDDLRQALRLFAFSNWPTSAPTSEKDQQAVRAKLEDWHTVFPSAVGVDRDGGAISLWPT